MPATSFSSRRSLATPSPLFAAALLLGGCGAEPEDTSAAALRLRFPAHADAVLSAREAFAPAAGGFRLAATEPGGAWVRAARPEVELPRDGSGVIRFRLAGGGEIRVRELGAAGEGAVAERAVSYRRAGGTSFWTATEGGVEEWLLLEAGVAQGGEVVAAWEVEGALLRERGAAVELVDEESGAPVLRVTAPRAHAASGRAVAPALRVRGARIELSVDVGDAGGEAVLVDPAWEPAGRMNVAPRNWHTATRLLNGKVLLAGGHDWGAAFASAELYDPTDDTWSLVSPMPVGRFFHTATLLQDGEVLVVGGRDEYGILSTVEGVERGPVDTVLYDPMTDAWTSRASMTTSRMYHTATLLRDGKVLVAGGGTISSTLSGAELYDPETDTWTPAASMSTARSDHAAALLLSSGKVLVAGGSPGRDASLRNAELYDPVTDTWTLTGSMTGGGGRPVTMAQLHNGEILVVSSGGAQRYDPAAGTWSPTRRMNGSHGLFSATMLYNGKVLVVGEPFNVGDGSVGNAELYDPETDTWTPTAPTNATYRDHSATRLLNGDVLLVGASVYPERYPILGTECASDADCGLSACVDGVCCESRCSEPCHTCALRSSLGRCVLQPKGRDARGECALEGCDGSCDGLGACSAVPKGDVCALAQCSDETHSMRPVLCLADGASCAGLSSEAREVVACAPYHCDQAGGTCKVTCSSLQDCVPGHACDFSGHCVRPSPPAANAGCSAGPAVAAAGAVRGGLGAVVLALLAVAQRRASGSRGRPTPRGEDS
ncbi:kelch repeat-containing protein [Sorangium sp. So ce1014]|uniref:Kelch repeat-containing protein n=1 Tax=Sorangium sp. So ce1014 TaxID=3133326 RepID=UPI003F6277A0